MKITDSLTLDASGLALTRDGYLVGDAKVSRAGNVQKYYGIELGLTDEDNAFKVFGVYRDPDVVFDDNSMLSLAGRPVTRGHPPVGVNADNWKELTVGQVGGKIRRDGEHVVASMAIMDAAAVKEVTDGARSLSAGYTVDVVPAEGTAADGTPYQFRQSGELRFNHVAYLPDNNPRAGNTRIGDANPTRWGAMPVQQDSNKEKSMSDKPLKTVTVDGLSIEVTDQGAQVITKLQKQIADADAAQTKLISDHKAAIDAKDGEIAKKDAEIDALKGKVLDGAALDAAVQARGDLVVKAKAIAPDVKTDGLSDAAIRKAVVVAKLGDAMADKGDAYIDARFDILAEDAAGTEQLRGAITHIKPVGDAAKVTNDAYSKSVDDLNSWRNQ
ncbi:hypothetical protein WYI_13997 [Ochrobactrum sp. CDB2]|nr:hypothetical protein WYI_13997 [Ochrobactrum sp. CDB2]